MPVLTPIIVSISKVDNISSMIVCLPYSLPLNKDFDFFSDFFLTFISASVVIFVRRREASHQLPYLNQHYAEFFPGPAGTKKSSM